MKFEQAEPEFRPVTITLETQEEVDILHALFGGAPGARGDDLIYKLYRRMSSTSDSNFGDYWVGDILNKE